MILKTLRDYIADNFSNWATAINNAEAGVTDYEIDTDTEVMVINTFDVNALPLILVNFDRGVPKFTTRFDYIWDLVVSAYVYERVEEDANYKAEMYLRALLYGLYQVPQGQATEDGITFTVREFAHLGSGVLSQGMNYLAGVELKITAYVNNFRT